MKVRCGLDLNAVELTSPGGASADRVLALWCGYMIITDLSHVAAVDLYYSLTCWFVIFFAFFCHMATCNNMCTMERGGGYLMF